MDFWIEFLSRLVDGSLTTLEILAVSIPSAVSLGILLGSLRVYGGKILSKAADIISSIFRGLPLIVTLMIFFFGLADLSILLPPFWAAVSAFTLCGGSYISEYIRNSIESIEEGQSQAAKALGMSRFQELIYVILPQALRKALPSISNEVIYMVKYSSLAYIIGVQEIFSVAKTYNSLYFKSIEIFTTIALIYLLMTTSANIIFRMIEDRSKIPGL